MVKGETDQFILISDPIGGLLWKGGSWQLPFSFSVPQHKCKPTCRRQGCTDTYNLIPWLKGRSVKAAYTSCPTTWCTCFAVCHAQPPLRAQPSTHSHHHRPWPAMPKHHCTLCSALHIGHVGVHPPGAIAVWGIWHRTSSPAQMLLIPLVGFQIFQQVPTNSTECEHSL